MLSIESVSDLSPGGENTMPSHFDVDALSNGRSINSTEYQIHHISKKDRQISTN